MGIRRGCLTAAAGELEILVRGEGGHGARPHQSVDAIWMAAKVVTELQQAISRRLDALQPVVVSFGKVEGGRAFNVIADQVRLLGTVRCLDLDQHAMLPGWIEDTVQAICAGCGGSAEVRYRCIAPPVDNDVALTNLLERCAIDRLGRDRVVPVEQPSLGAEDFAELLRDVPAQQRDGNDRVQALPVAVVGSALILSCGLGRRRRRARLFANLKRSRVQDGDG